MIAFEYSQLPARVVFGFGTIARIPDEVQTLGCRRVLVLCDPHYAAEAAARVIDTLGDAAVGLSIDAAMHTPVEITDRVMEQVRKTKADCLLPLGGGSTTGLGKALALRTFNAAAARRAIDRVAHALGVNSAAPGLFDLAASLGAPTALKSIGMSEGDLDKAADLAVSTPYWNPQEIERNAIRALLDDAFHGRRPSD